jgi:hypothetical protein
MKCYRHRDQDAVGLCKACGRGLCPACAAEVGKGLACRRSCEQEVADMNALIDQNIRSSPIGHRLLAQSRGAGMAQAWFLLLAGAAFLATALLTRQVRALPGLLGLLFVGYGVLSFFRAARIPRKPQ